AALRLGLHAVLLGAILTLDLLVTVLHLIATLGRGLVTMLGGRALITLHRALAGCLAFLGLHAAAVFFTLGLHVLVLPAFTALGLHVLAALHVIFGAL